LTERTAHDLAGYDKTVISELELLLDEFPSLRGEKVDTVFFGGGTPTLMSSDQFRNVLAALAVHFSVNLPDTKCELTTEANPDTLTPEFISSLVDNGITRLSIGVQSFDSEVLKTLERVHNQVQVSASVETAKSFGLETSIDLIYGCPGETLESWKRTLEEAVALRPDHISCYALTLEKNVPLAAKIRRGEIAEIDEDLQAQMYELADEVLWAAGYQWYEISNWARDGKRCRHNLNYWRNTNWLGLGPSAHSHLNSLETGNLRFWNTRNVAKYINSIQHGNLAREGQETLTDDETRLERIMLNVRLNQPIDALPNTVRTLLTDGLIDENRTPTLKGRMLNDKIVHALDSETRCSRYGTTRCMSCPQCIME
jgi:oxygen-independent coproporphyrinogen-3 oxidase